MRAQSRKHVLSSRNSCACEPGFEFPPTSAIVLILRNSAIRHAPTLFCSAKANFFRRSPGCLPQEGNPWFIGNQKEEPNPGCEAARGGCEGEEQRILAEHRGDKTNQVVQAVVKMRCSTSYGAHLSALWSSHVFNPKTLVLERYVCYRLRRHAVQQLAIDEPFQNRFLCGWSEKQSQPAVYEGCSILNYYSAATGCANPDATSRIAPARPETNKRRSHRELLGINDASDGTSLLPRSRNGLCLL